MYAIMALAIGIIALKNYQLFSIDLLSNDSDFSSHAIRPYFFLEDYSYTKEWYNGTSLFMYYPPVSVLIDTFAYFAVGNLGLALALSMLLLQIMLLWICLQLARALGRESIDGAFACAVILSSTISVGRFFNSGRYGEFAGFVMLFLWILAIAQYLRKPSNRSIAFVFIASLLASLTHFLESIILLGFLAIMGGALIAIKGKMNGRIKNALAISIAGLAPSILFWAPFISASNKPSIVGIALSGYILLVGGLLILIAAGLFIIKYRSVASIGIALLLIGYGLGKAAYFPPQLGDDFPALELDGKYFLLRDVPTTAYSVLAARGFSSPLGNYDPAGDAALIEKYMEVTTECGSIREFSGYTGSRYVISGKAELAACGFKAVYSGKFRVYRID